MTILLVIIGAAIGAPLRYLTDRIITARHHSVFPYGTLTVNVFGSLLLGFLLGAAPSPALMALLGTGFCGALTTYSTFGYETVRLGHDHLYRPALLNIATNLVLGCGAAFAGFGLARAIF